MHLLYADETNLDPRESKFFVYGGITIPVEAAQELSRALEKARVAAKIAPEFLLKFNNRPDHLDHEGFIAVKKEFIRAAVEARCVLLVSIILHAVATNPDEARRKEINRLLYHFDCFLIRPNSSGLVLMDRFSDRQIDAHLREKFSTGVTGLPYSSAKRLERILGFHYSAIGQSHFSSLIDIVLGSLRFAVNAHQSENPNAKASARKVLEQLAPLFFSERSDGAISELSLFFSPKIIKVQSYRRQYETLRAFFSECGIQPQQRITNERNY